MASPSESTEVPSPRRRWLRRLGYGVGALAAIILVAWLAVPPIVRAQLESRLTEVLGRPTTVEAVAFDPFRLHLTVRKLSVARRAGVEPLFAFDELVADLSAASLWHRAPVLDSLRILRPRLSLTRDAQGQYNVDDLIEAIFSKRIVMPLVSLNNIEIDDGNVVLVDEVTARRHELAALDIGIPFLSSLPYEAEIRVTPRVNGTINGSHFALSGSSAPFAEHREGTLEIDLDALPLASYVAYLPSKPRVVLAGGALTTRLKVVFIQGNSGGHRLELRGDARIDGLAINRRDGTALAAARRFAVGIDRIDVFGHDARIATVAIDAPVVDVKRLADRSSIRCPPLPRPCLRPGETPPGPFASTTSR